MLAGGPARQVRQPAGNARKSRICAFLNSSSDEYILDSKRATWPGSETNIRAQADTIGTINFNRTFRTYSYDFMWFLTAESGFQNSRLTYLGFHTDPYWRGRAAGRQPSCGRSTHTWAARSPSAC